MLECLECEAEIKVPSDVKLGDTIACKMCGELFEVVELDPLEIDYPDDDEIWDEDWEDDLGGVD
jgi:lysine biosynthesis protein LysW